MVVVVAVELLQAKRVSDFRRSSASTSRGRMRNSPDAPELSDTAAGGSERTCWGLA